MHPTCEVPNCNEDSVGRMSLFSDMMSGSLFVSLCGLHFGCVLNGIPALLDALKPIQRDG